MKYKKSKFYYYFRKQRIYGAIVVALGILSAIALDGDITAALLLVPLGLYVMFTKKMVVTDDYFWEMEAKKCDKWRDPRDF